MSSDQSFFEERLYEEQDKRPRDNRMPFQRDRARIMHSAAFRRLQGKTQVMGTGEGDFHRTRLTHSIEVAQIGYGLLSHLDWNKALYPQIIQDWLPHRDLIEAACLAHDLGHPPFGHKGEKALHRAMLPYGGFEGNGQTLRILTKLEKYKERGKGLYPTRRLVLAVLKYPCAMKDFGKAGYENKPPKCYHDDEREVVKWALQGFTEADQIEFQRLDCEPKHHSFDCSILELADDIAYGIHDIEDIVARGLASEQDIRDEVKKAFAVIGGSIPHGENRLGAKTVCDGLLKNSFDRKQMISDLVNLFVTNVIISPKNEKFEHPLLQFNAALPEPHKTLLKAIKDMSWDLVIKKAKVQQLEWRGQLIVTQLFETLITNPEALIPKSTWDDGSIESTKERRVCDFIAGMTDSYAEKLHKRLFQPGFGSSGDEL